MMKTRERISASGLFGVLRVSFYLLRYDAFRQPHEDIFQRFTLFFKREKGNIGLNQFGDQGADAHFVAGEAQFQFQITLSILAVG